MNNRVCRQFHSERGISLIFCAPALKNKRLNTSQNELSTAPGQLKANQRLAGVDEVGRGPLAGDVVACAVILPADHDFDGLTDSKQLSARQREALFTQIHQFAVSISLGRASVAEIDRFNIGQASLLAMQRAVLGLSLTPDHVLVDGLYCPDLPYPTQALIKGDQSIPAISAASIIAKVTRDREMIALESQYPGYGFASHKGYPTAQHLQALRQLGVTPLHRRSFAPVRRLLEHC